jgi:hypothetical protein
MPAPNKVTRKLTEALGTDAGDAMADWMNGTDERFLEVRADIAELKHETDVRFADLKQEMNVRFAEFRAEMRTGFANVDTKFAMAEAAAAKRHADFMKWTLGFWAVSLVTLVGAIATLSRMLP